MCAGKTLQSISLMASLSLEQRLPRPHLVVVPLSVLGNWLREVAFWCPQLKAQKFHGNREERLAQKDALMEEGGFDVCVTTYETVAQEVSALRKIDFEMLVIDEAHRLKNESSKLSSLLRQLSSARRLLLTGTPIQNNLHELWALLNFLYPEVFTSVCARARSPPARHAVSPPRLTASKLVRAMPHASERPSFDAVVFFGTSVGDL